MADHNQGHGRVSPGKLGKFLCAVKTYVNEISPLSQWLIASALFYLVLCYFYNMSPQELYHWFVDLFNRPALESCFRFPR